MKTQLRLPFVLAALAAVALVGRLRAEEVPTTIKFSDPNKPGTVKVVLAHGDLRITGSDAKEVTVKTDSKVTNQKRRDGLRVLTASTSYSLSEKDNVVTLDAMGEGWGGGSADFHLTVPRNTSITVASKWGGDVSCTSLSGDIDINSTNGEIRLDEVAGGVAVETMNGEIRANIRELHANKPLSFTSTNGEVVVRVLPDAKANISLRTQNGMVLTDFDEPAISTKTETVPGTKGPRRGPGAKMVTVNVDRIREQARSIEAQARTMAAQALRTSGDAAATMKADAERLRAEADKMKAEADKMKVDTDVNVTVAVAPKPAAVPKTPSTPGVEAPPAPPAMPGMPTITGGKLVTGTLNGGGPEISIRTMNGDVKLVKWDPNAPTTNKR